MDNHTPLDEGPRVSPSPLVGERPRVRGRLSLSLALILLAVSSATAADWPTFRGNPSQTGVANDKLPDKLEILWQFKAKDGIESGAAIVAGTAYVSSYDGFLYALDLATGAEKWRYKGAPFKAPPSVRDGAVYVGDGDGIFHCVDAATGKKRWSFEAGAEVSSGANFAGDSVLFGTEDETLYCVKEGKLVWKFRVPGGPVMGSPAIAGDRTFAAGCDSTLHIIDLKTGKEVGNKLDLNGQIGASAAVIDQRLFVGTMSSQILAVDWTKPAIDWAFEPQKRAQAFYSSAAVTDSLVIAGSRDKHLHAVERATGKEKWSFQTQGKVDSSPVVVGSRVYVGSFDSNLYVLDLEKGTEIQHIHLTGQISATPAVADGKLVIGTQDGVVYCLGKK